jgi:hypothetical protein
MVWRHRLFSRQANGVLDFVSVNADFLKQMFIELLKIANCSADYGFFYPVLADLR